MQEVKEHVKDIGWRDMDISVKIPKTIVEVKLDIRSIVHNIQMKGKFEINKYKVD